MRAEQVTYKALFRGHRPEQAIKLTSRRVVRGWPIQSDDGRGNLSWSRVETPDEKLAKKLNLPIVEEHLHATKTKPARKIHRLVVPPQYVPLNSTARSPLFGALMAEVECSGAHHENWNLPPDPVIETKLKNGRTVWVNSFLSKTLQRMVLLTVQDRAEQSMCEHSHAYRRGRTRFTALADVARLAAQYPYPVPLDIERYFKSVTPALAEAAIGRAFPWIHWTLRRVMEWLLSPRVILRADNPDWWPPLPGQELSTLRHVPEGSVLAPFACNVVGDVVVGRPFEVGMGGRAVLVRYSDDMVVMGRRPMDAAVGAEVIERLLTPYGLHLHPDWPEPVDIRLTPIKWLGKRIHGGSVQTPEGDLHRYTRLLVDAHPATHEFRQTARWVLTELNPDGPRRIDFVSRRLRAASKSQWQAFELLRTARLPPLPEPEPDDLDALEASTAKEAA